MPRARSLEEGGGNLGGRRTEHRDPYRYSMKGMVWPRHQEDGARAPAPRLRLSTGQIQLLPTSESLGRELQLHVLRTPCGMYRCEFRWNPHRCMYSYSVSQVSAPYGSLRIILGIGFFVERSVRVRVSSYSEWIMRFRWPMERSNILLPWSFDPEQCNASPSS